MTHQYDSSQYGKDGPRVSSFALSVSSWFYPFIVFRVSLERISQFGSVPPYAYSYQFFSVLSHSHTHLHAHANLRTTRPRINIHAHPRNHTGTPAHTGLETVSRVFAASSTLQIVVNILRRRRCTLPADCSGRHSALNLPPRF